MKKNILYIAALSFLAAACNVVDLNPVQGGEEQAPAANMIIETVSGTTEMSTKATIADANGAFAWTAGDNIAVHISNGKYVFTSDTGAEGASTAGASASFKVAYDNGYSRDAFAVYPSTIVSADAANYGQSGATLDVNLPSSYKLSEVSGTTTPCPMIATNAPSSGWTFSQLCGLLRLTVNSIPPTAMRLEIDFNGKKVWGEFEAQDPTETPGTPVVTAGKAVISTSDDAACDVITITKDGSVALDGSTLNIPLPLGTYTKITVTAYNALTGGDAIFTNTRTFDYTAKRANGTKRYAPAVFSVSGSKRVVFSRGNLQATYKYISADEGSWTWGFAAHQYDHIGNAGGNKMISTSTKEGTAPLAKLSGNGTVDLFGWSTNATYYGIAKSTEDNHFSGSFVDWGTISTFNGITYPSDYWETMSCGNDTAPIPEWWYLMRSESGRMPAATIGGVANARFARAIINKGESPDVSVKGIIIFPDDYNGPTSNVGTDGSVIKWGLINSYSKSSSFSDGTQCTTAGWKILEEAGCVFLPISGYREGNTVNYSTSEMRYASCSERSSTHINLLSYKEGEYIFWNIDSNHKHSGVAVRLVHEIK